MRERTAFRRKTEGGVGKRHGGGQGANIVKDAAIIYSRNANEGKRVALTGKRGGFLRQNTIPIGA